MPAPPFATVAYPGDLVEHLRALVALAVALDQPDRPSAFTRAATGLAIDVSVLRRRISTLAAFAGAALVTGRGSGLRLTAAGLRVRQRAGAILELAAAIPRATDDDGPLRVACTGTILAEVLPGVLAAVRRAHPRLRLHVRREGAERARRLLSSGEIDFAIVRGDLHEPGPVHESRRLTEDRLWLVAPRALVRSSLRRVTPAAIARHPLIGYPAGSTTMRRVMTVIGPLGGAASIEVDRKAAAIAYAAAGLGVAFVSLVAGQRPEVGAAVVARDVTRLFPRAAFWLLWQRGAPPSGWRRAFAARLEASLARGR
jgi:DNA-binding transcriptional LysR family regulator